MAFDAKSVAAEIVRLVGGKENINSVAHCMTRLRFVVKDLKRADQEALKKVPGVLGVIYAGGQLMVVLGKNLLPVYETVVKDYGLTEGAAVNENPDTPEEKKPLTFKSAGVAVLDYVSASVAPIITGLVAGGMLKVVLLLITLVNAGFAETATYVLLSGLADAPFFFMPIFAAYGAAKKLGGTPIYSMMCAAALLHGKYTALVAAGEPVTLLGIPVRLMSYSSSLLPALLIALCAYYLEKFFNKIVPGIFKSLLVGLCTVTVTMVLGFTVLAPLGGYLGNYLAIAFGFLGDRIGFITVGLLAACLPWLVMCGMHLGLVPFMTQALTNPGYDAVFRPAFILHNMAEGGACIGVALRTKDAEKRAEAFSIAFGCIVAGVTEPAIYGINLPRKKPMYGVMAGGAVGGVVAGLLGARAYVMGYSTVLALPIFQNTILAMSIAIVTAIVVAAAVTYVLDNEKKTSVFQNATKEKQQSSFDPQPMTVLMPLSGSVMHLDVFPDKVFASGTLGSGCGIEPDGDTLYAPFNGKITQMMDTKHAIGLESADGIELLIHVGVDTVKMEGKGFKTLVEEGDTVKAGAPLLKFDRTAIKAAGHPTAVAVIVTNTDDYSAVNLLAQGIAAPGVPLMKVSN